MKGQKEEPVEGRGQGKNVERSANSLALLGGQVQSRDWLEVSQKPNLMNL